MTYGIKIKVRCPSCGKSLMNPEVPVDDLASIEFLVKIANRMGALYLSQIYGSYNKVFDGIEDLKGAVVECSCPHCHQPFPVRRACPNCAAPIIILDLEAGGIIKVCSRNGCKMHSLEFEDADDAFKLFQNQDTSELF
jgi:uncharacterized OB-fold protein